MRKVTHIQMVYDCPILTQQGCYMAEQGDILSVGGDHADVVPYTAFQLLENGHATPARDMSGLRDAIGDEVAA